MNEKLDKKIDSFGEIEFLIELINEYKKYEDFKFGFYKKILIIMLCTKMETFLEKITSQWFEKLQSDKLNNCSMLPKIAKEEIVKESIDKIYGDLINGKITYQNKSKLFNLNILTDELLPLSDLDVDFVIKMGTHGSGEITKILRHIGIENIFEDINDNSFTDNLGNININVKKDYKGIIDKLVNYRNKILHEDNLTPVTLKDLDEFIIVINKLCLFVTEYIKEVEIECFEIEEGEFDETKV